MAKTYTFSISIYFLEGINTDRDLCPAYFMVKVSNLGSQPVLSPFMLRKGDLQGGKIVGTADYCEVARQQFAIILRKAEDHFINHYNAGTILTPPQMVGFIRSLDSETQGLMIVAVAEDYRTTQLSTKKWKPGKKNLKGEVTKGSAERMFLAMMVKFIDFIQAEHGAKDYPLHAINVRMLTRFEMHLRKSIPKSVGIYIICFISMIRYCVTQGYLKAYPFEEYNTNRLTITAESNPEALERKISHPDVVVLKTTPMDDPQVERLRLIAVIQVCTGMAWADLNAIGKKVRDHITVDLSGNASFMYNRVKNGNIAIIPYFPEIKETLEKLQYNIDPGSYKSYCYGLKRIFEKLKIKLGGKQTDKFSHTLRHAFGSEMLELGFKMESISLMLGHRSVTITEKIYARINGDKVHADYQKIKKQQQLQDELKMRLASA